MIRRPDQIKRALKATTVTDTMVKQALDIFEGNTWGDTSTAMENALTAVLGPVRTILEEK